MPPAKKEKLLYSLSFMIIGLLMSAVMLTFGHYRYGGEAQIVVNLYALMFIATGIVYTLASLLDIFFYP